MQSFLEKVVGEIVLEGNSLEDTIFVLPSKRAGTFLKTILARKAEATFFAPEIYSTESFVEELSQLAYAGTIDQLFALYNSYKNQDFERKDDFYTFCKWGQTLLQDFNEVDRYLIDTEKLFTNLSAIQELNHWSLQADKTKMMEDYLKFWNSLENIYRDFCHILSSKGLGHQGLVYREACLKLNDYLVEHDTKKFIFIGFNALNTAESTIIQSILDSGRGDIYWDIDQYFFEDPIHDAGHFIREHIASWPYYKKHSPKGISGHFKKSKRIEIIGVPKNVSQAKFTGSLLKNLVENTNNSLSKTALILGDENLMNPILNSIPSEIEAINLTMGFPLGKTPLATFFEAYIELYINQENGHWFYKNVLSFLSLPYVQIILNEKDIDRVSKSQQVIRTNNLTYINVVQLIELIDSEHTGTLFLKKVPHAKELVANCMRLISLLKIKLYEAKDDLGLEYLYHFYTLFNQLSNVLDENDFVTDLKSVQALFRELLNSETLDFQGEPLEGLQIMGMLESRNLDYERVLITSVNEGVLPSGKSNNSFIPFDLKVKLGLPTYKEKDAVYTYHFYRLLQRAKEVYLLYNTEPDVLEGGEPSRLITQLLTENIEAVTINNFVATPMVSPNLVPKKIVHKDAGLLEMIAKHAKSGFSPTSLSNYIRNPIDFYKRNLLGIDDIQEVEETVAANTFGTILHDSLEDLYQPFIGAFLEIEKLKKVKKSIRPIVTKHFMKVFVGGDFSTGQNLIAYNVVVRYIENFIASEIEELKEHSIRIVGLEQKLNTQISLDERQIEINLKGKLDRIDEYDGTLRIIDFKTGKVSPGQVEIVEWPEIISDYEYSKAFQLLCYAYMYFSQNTIDNLESGIYSFKNTSAGLMRFATKEAQRSRKKDTTVTNETIAQFEKQLKRLITEILDAHTPFEEKEV